MKIYQVNGQWFASVSGGYRNNDNVSADKMGPFIEKPEPMSQWKETESNQYGSGHSKLTQFRAGEKMFTVQSYSWAAAYGYSWEENWESFSSKKPPALGESFKWTDSGWVACEHPQAV